MRQTKVKCPKCGKTGELRLYPAKINRTPTDTAAIFHTESVKQIGGLAYREVSEACHFGKWPV